MRVVHPGDAKANEQCGLFCWHPRFCQKYANVSLFVVVMCAVIAVQGTYLGYMVGVLTSLERRFELSSSRSGLLLSMYDIGNTFATIFVGYCGTHRHKPRWTAGGVVLSAVAMFGMTIPAMVYGGATNEERDWEDHGKYVDQVKCDPLRILAWDMNEGGLSSYNCQKHSNNGAYVILAISQLLAGISAAPFNTLAYVYIDDNVQHKNSPFYLGLLTSMYAFGPALGFGLSAICNYIYVSPGNAPQDLQPGNPSWVGAWWLGFLLCAIVYLILTPPLMMFPYKLPKQRKNKRPVQAQGNHYNPQEMEMMTEFERPSTDTVSNEDDDYGCIPSLVDAAKAMPSDVWRLLKNPVFVSMMMGWIFGSYLVGGYGTYLAKYIETQYAQTASAADLYAGLISIGAVALSTAVGGYILTKFNMTPQQSILALIVSWSVIMLTYLLGMATGCHHPQLQGCEYDYMQGEWEHCRCSYDSAQVNLGFCDDGCWQLPLYVIIMFIGLFIGNMFFMTTMMVVLRAVEDEQKSLALSFASCITNIFSFIPAPIIFGSIIDRSCNVWHSLCPHQLGNCIVYDNDKFRIFYHLGNAGFQCAAIISVVVTYILARKFKFPEDDSQSEWSEAEADETRQTELD